MFKPKILIISDEPETARVWGYSMNQIGFDVTLIGIADQPMQTFANDPPDLIIIEDFNTEVEELELCQQLRKETVVPILYLTGKTAETFLLQVYQAGADECIPLPVSPRLFQAKVRAWQRRVRTIPAAAIDNITAGDFNLDIHRRRITTTSGESVTLTNLEARLLLVLLSHPGEVFDSSQLVERVWGYFGEGDTVLLKNLVYRLRRKIELDPSQPRYLRNAARSGYWFQPEG